MCSDAIKATEVCPPAAEISSGLITAKLYLPDAKSGYYRGTRFDWSGVIFSLTYEGHQYFGEWQESRDPFLHDRITGPVEEFRTNNSALGYSEVASGGCFVRIGVGVCRKPSDEEYQWRKTYELLDPGVWRIEWAENWIEFVHEIQPASANGFGYVYVKRIVLDPSEPILTIVHRLSNTGRKIIETDVYNHNFFVIDGRPTGPEFVVKFAWPLHATSDLKDIAVLRDNELHYLRELGEGEFLFTGLEGFGVSAGDHRFSIENRKANAGVTVSTDKPLARVNYWSPRTTLCPEPYIEFRVGPGESESWRTEYTFFTVD